MSLSIVSYLDYGSFEGCWEEGMSVTDRSLLGFFVSIWPVVVRFEISWTIPSILSWWFYDNCYVLDILYFVNMFVVT